jgi:hypothetical protein
VKHVTGMTITCRVHTVPAATLHYSDGTDEAVILSGKDASRIVSAALSEPLKAEVAK